jgi:CAAD domains of cyanobacterial aminoacyl-tRNA synthetase
MPATLLHAFTVFKLWLLACCLLTQWENTNNKTSVVLYSVGAVVALWLTSTVVGAVNNVPLVSWQSARAAAGLQAPVGGVAAASWCCMYVWLLCRAWWHLVASGGGAQRVAGHVFRTARCTWTCSVWALVCALQLPKLLELVGLGYSAWFTYRYLLFKVRPRRDVQNLGWLNPLLIRGVQCFAAVRGIASRWWLRFRAPGKQQLVVEVYPARCSHVYLLRLLQSSREELIEDVEELKKKVRSYWYWGCCLCAIHTSMVQARHWFWLVLTAAMWLQITGAVEDAWASAFAAHPAVLGAGSGGMFSNLFSGRQSPPFMIESLELGTWQSMWRRWQQCALLMVLMLL